MRWLKPSGFLFRRVSEGVCETRQRHSPQRRRCRRRLSHNQAWTGWPMPPPARRGHSRWWLRPTSRLRRRRPVLRKLALAELVCVCNLEAAIGY